MSICIRRPVRQRHIVEVDVIGSPSEVFALMCPVREHEWVAGWKTNTIWSDSGVVEDGCIFTTPLAPEQPDGSSDDEAVWLTTHHDQRARQLEIVKFSPKQTVTRLQISVAPNEAGSRLSVAYELSALSDIGVEMVKQHTAEGLERKIRLEWKPAIERNIVGDTDLTEPGQ